MSTAGYLQDAKNQQKRLAETITSKGITATATEKYKDLVDKVAQIENLKGEERTLENFTNVLSEPKSVVQLKYPDNTPKTLNAKLGSKNLFDTANATKLNGAASFSVTNNVITVSQNANYAYSSANVLIPKSLIGKTITLSAKSNTSGVNVAGLRIQWVSGSAAAAGDMILGVPDSTGNIVVTGTVPAQPDEAHSNLCLMVYSNTTGTLETGTTYTATYSDIQIELDSTATSYTPYISDFSTVNVTRCGKNLIPYPYYDTTKTLNGITFTVNADGSVTVSGTSTEQAYFKLQQSFSLKKGQYFFSGCPTGGAGSTYSLYLSTSDYKFYKADIGNGISINSEDGKTVSIVINIAKNTTVENLVFKPQLELGSTATSYEPYQGQTYTPTATGEVTGITNLYPTTTLLTNNAGVVFEQVTGGTYKEILPSTDKNSITKVYQPSVDSSIDSNIKPENIKKGVKILGILGTYDGN